MVKMCKATTKKGTPCRFNAKEGSDYCGIHNGKIEEQDIDIFMERNKGVLQKHFREVIAFLLGTVADPIASDVYDYIKERFEMRHLVPPVKEASKKSLFRINRETSTRFADLVEAFRFLVRENEFLDGGDLKQLISNQYLRQLG